MKRKSIIIKMVFIFILLAIGLTYIYKSNIKFDIKYLENYINSYGDMAGIIFILFFSLRTLLIVFPYSVMVIVGGNIFGHSYGFLYSMISVFISASIAFYISRFTGKENFLKILKGRAKKLNIKIEEHGFRIIFIMRISLVFPFDILSYASGLTKIKYKHFILGTVIGVMPETFSLTYLGENLNNPFSFNFIVSIVLVAITVVTPTIVKRCKAIKTKSE